MASIDARHRRRHEEEQRERVNRPLHARFAAGTPLACFDDTTLLERDPMSGPLAAYLVAFFAMLFAGISALTLIATVRSLDPPEDATPEQVDEAAPQTLARSA